jgi:NAD(P)-dependent dehydrogenase (short-subunit alcohol dehydrogenase family)
LPGFGFETTRELGAHRASKHAAENVADALRRELAIFEIHVIAIDPGSIRTPLFDKLGALNPATGTLLTVRPRRNYPRCSRRHSGTRPRPQKVSAATCRGIEAHRPTTRYPLHPLW